MTTLRERLKPMRLALEAEKTKVPSAKEKAAMIARYEAQIDKIATKARDKGIKINYSVAYTGK